MDVPHNFTQWISVSVLNFFISCKQFIVDNKLHVFISLYAEIIQTGGPLTLPMKDTLSYDTVAFVTSVKVWLCQNHNII